MTDEELDKQLDTFSESMRKAIEDLMATINDLQQENRSLRQLVEAQSGKIDTLQRALDEWETHGRDV